MTSLTANRNVWLGVLLGALGLVYVWSMADSGRAELPHTLAALTVLVPLVIFGLLLRSPWPAAAALVFVVIIDLSLA